MSDPEWVGEHGLRLERILGELPEQDAHYLRAYIGHLEHRGEDSGAGLALVLIAGLMALLGFALGWWLG